MRTAVNVVRKVYRFELASVILVLGVFAALSFVEAARLDLAKPSAGCWGEALAAEEQGEDEAAVIDCPSREPWFALNRETGQFLGLFTFLPVFSGALLGSVLVSREIEHRTIQTAWSLGPSRRRWLAERVGPVVVLLAILLTAVALAANELEAGRTIGVDPRSSLHEYGDRDISLVLRGLAAFCVAVLVGAIAGRQLPALIVSSILALVVLAAINATFPFGAEPRLIDSADRPRSSFEQDSSVLVFQGRRSRDGTIVSVEQALSRAPGGLTEDATHEWMRANFESVEVRYFGDQLIDIELREAAVLGLLSILSLGAAFVVVERHTPSS